MNGEPVAQHNALPAIYWHGDFMPSSSWSATSEGTPRMVEVIGATVTVDR